MAGSHLITASVDGVLQVTINRPEKRNALSRAVLIELGETFDAHAADDRLRVAVLRGAGDKSFAAGGDLHDLSAVRTFDDAVTMAEQAKAALHAIRRFPVPVIAALNGDAMGGGAELAVACDFRVAATQARLGFIQGRLNISTAWGGGIDLMHLVGPSTALGLLCRSNLLDGAEALSLGLIDALAPEGQNFDTFVADFLVPFLRQVPQVLRAFKALAYHTRAGWPRTELDALETRLFAANWVHDDHWTAADKILPAKE
jgi:enoyl-CoA hydratase